MSGRATNNNTAAANSGGSATATTNKLDAMPPLSLDGDWGAGPALHKLEDDGTTSSPLSAASSASNSNSARAGGGGGGGGGGDPTWQHPAHVEQAQRLAAYKAGVVEMLQEHFQVRICSTKHA